MKNEKLLNKPVSIIFRDARMPSATGMFLRSDFGSDYILIAPFAKDSIEAKTWPASVMNPLHICGADVLGVFELINTNDEKTASTSSGTEQKYFQQN